MRKMFNLLYNLWNKLSQGLLQMFSASVLNNAMGMIGNMVITRMLSKMEYGIWSYVLNIYSYLVLITGFGLLDGAFQFGAENRGKRQEFQYYKYCLRVGIVIDTFLVVAFWVITFIVKFSMPEATIYLRIIAPMLVLEYILNLLLIILRCENRIKKYAKILNINTIFLMLGTCGGAFFGVMGVVIGKYIAYIFSLIQVLCNIRQEVDLVKKADNMMWNHTRDLWHYSIFTGITSALNCLLYLLDVSMIASMIKDPIEVAIYKVATIIPTALAFIPNSVITCILPNIVLNNKNYIWLRTNVKRAFLGLGLLNIVICSVCIWGAPIIISILSGNQYLSAVPIFRILILAYFITGTFRSMSTNILAALRCVNYGLCMSIICAICNIVFNYNFISKYGTVGAAYATLGVATVAAILSFGYMSYKLMNGKS